MVKICGGMVLFEPEIELLIQNIKVRLQICDFRIISSNNLYT